MAGFEILDLSICSNLFQPSPGVAGIVSYLLKLAANKFLSRDAIYLARLVINIEHCGVGGVKYKNGIVCRLDEVAIFAPAVDFSLECSLSSPGKDCKSTGQ